MDRRILRIIDADLNRLLEGLRVCEEIMRFIISDKKLTLKFKNLRHEAVEVTKHWGINSNLLLRSRDSLKDAGKVSIKSEFKRSNYQDIFYANIQRAKESLRVLEEFVKLESITSAGNFKKLRYKLYQIEKETNTRLLSLCNN